jgi:hypothetical protein
MRDGLHAKRPSSASARLTFPLDVSREQNFAILQLWRQPELQPPLNAPRLFKTPTNAIKKDSGMPNCQRLDPKQDPSIPTRG